MLAVAAVILLLSQVKIPDWKLGLDALPNNILAGQLQNPHHECPFPALYYRIRRRRRQLLVVSSGLPCPFHSATPHETLETYAVQAGDTILGIAGKYGLRPETVL